MGEGRDAGSGAASWSKTMVSAPGQDVGVAVDGIAAQDATGTGTGVGLG